MLVEKLVPVHEVAFDDDQVSTDDCPVVCDEGLAEIVAVGADAEETVIAVHAPQLLFSFDSAIVPADPAELLSAQARTYHVAAEVNEYDSVAMVFPPLATVAAV